MPPIEPIAIIGQAGILPDAPHIATFRENLLRNHQAIRPIPDERWGFAKENLLDPSGKPDTAISGNAGLVSIPPLPPFLAAENNPHPGIQQPDAVTSLLLQTTATAIQETGLSPASCRKTGIIAGALALPTETVAHLAAKRFRAALLNRPAAPLSREAALGAMVVGAPATLTADILGLGGPSFTLDGACASSLVAIKLACDALRSHRADQMIAGGVSRPEIRFTQIGFTQLQALSPSGICSPFDENADGLVTGEGCALVVLKRLSDALRDQDPVLAVIRGMGISNDTGGNLLAPQVAGQVLAMQAAYAQAKMDPAAIDAVECHGTGTPTGDPVEIRSMSRIWPHAGGPVIASVKSMIGHLLTAAGSAGLLRMLACLATDTLPATPTFSKAPEKGPLAQSGFSLHKSPVPWERPTPQTPRRFAVNAFGFGGINAHLVAEECLPAPEPRPFVESRHPQTENQEIAIVGISVKTPDLFDETLFSDPAPVLKTQPNRLQDLTIPLAAFPIPPNEIPDILPPHLAALLATRTAVEKAGWKKEALSRTGVIAAMDFDTRAADHVLRWEMETHAPSHPGWAALSPAGKEEWVEGLKDAAARPLTATRVVGSLGSMIASRIAKTFGLGGPSYTVSCGAAGGLLALGQAVDCLVQKEADRFIVCATDFGSHPLQEEIRRALGHTDQKDAAVSVLLKRKKDAQKDGDTIWAVIDPVCFSHGKAPVFQTPPHILAAAPDFSSAAKEISAISPASSHPSTALLCANGDAGAAAGLLATAMAASALHHKIIPKTEGNKPLPPPLCRPPFYLPRFPGHSFRNRTEGDRTAFVLTANQWMPPCHLRLREAPLPPEKTPASPVRFPAGLFPLAAGNPQALFAQCESLIAFAATLSSETPVYLAAEIWRNRHPATGDCRAAVLTLSTDRLSEWCQALMTAIQKEESAVITGKEGIAYLPQAPKGSLALVYPGSGNHAPGMGRAVGVFWPEIMAAEDFRYPNLKDQMLPEYTQPWRALWPSDWQKASMEAMTEDATRPIFAQVTYGGMMTRVWEKLRIPAHAAIGYSLGETTGFFATGLWPDRSLMQERLAASSLFSEVLAGPCSALRQQWGIDPESPFSWSVAVFPVPADTIDKALGDFPLARRLIVNTPHETVVGGEEKTIQAMAEKLDVRPHFLPGVITVHCDAMAPAKDAYRTLHTFPVQETGLTYYSCAGGAPFLPTPKATAEAIVRQNLHGFDYVRTIRRAYEDGIRIFVEAGPGDSCTRMIRSILKDRPHVAVSLSRKGEAEPLSVMRAAAILHAAGLDPDFSFFHKNSDTNEASPLGTEETDPHPLTVPVLSAKPLPEIPAPAVKKIPFPKKEAVITPQKAASPKPLKRPEHRPAKVSPKTNMPDPKTDPIGALLYETHRLYSETARLHTQYLDASEKNIRQLQSLLTGTPCAAPHSAPRETALFPAPVSSPPSDPVKPLLYDKDACLTFARGRVADVLGSRFEVVDTYPVRVRLPEPPLMLVDRILSISGTKGTPGKGEIVTEHDVLPDAWYLDGGRTPFSIAIEAGQADLFLCAWMGIDLQVQGTRAYRLLDATATFHRHLPRPGETIRYEIAIDRFIRQGETWLFFFRFTGFINGEKLITMENGCAGFFTEEEINRSGGILPHFRNPAAPSPSRLPSSVFPVPVFPEGPLSKEKMAALRNGDAAAAFGDVFAGKTIAPGLRLPSGRLQLVHEITKLAANGGDHGNGIVCGTAAIHPDDWFLTCHFVDDPVMPGTLMYECCVQTLRVFTLAAGWMPENPHATYEPVPGAPSVLKCRGPVRPSTNTVSYEIHIRGMGYRPEPFVIADALMVADGKPIVRFEGMSLMIRGAAKEDLEAIWRENPPSRPDGLWDRMRLETFTEDLPSKSLGKRYRPFDSGRFLARLPRPPFLMMDAVVENTAPQAEIPPEAHVTALLHQPETAWWFQADPAGIMPYAVLLETALQPCGFLAAWMGCSLASHQDLRFRNLGGNARTGKPVIPGAPVRTRVSLTRFAKNQDLQLLFFTLTATQNHAVVLEADTHFGFFTDAALAGQSELAVPPGLHPDLPKEAIVIRDPAALLPQPETDAATAMTMIHRILAWDPAGGPAASGKATAEMDVNPEDWYFTAHFKDDPVCPGSLGLEAVLTTMKWMAKKQFGNRLQNTIPVMDAKNQHSWTYRGQILPQNKKMTVTVAITRTTTDPAPLLVCDAAVFTDDRCIYTVKDFALLFPGKESYAL